MKIITAMKSSLKAIVAAACAVGLATSVSAAPPGKGVFKVGSYKHAGTVEEIQSLKTGDQYALVCSDCHSCCSAIFTARMIGVSPVASL